MRHPQWKKRQLQAKAEREAAERKARHDAFWAAVEKRPKLIEPQEITFITPADIPEEHYPIG